MRKIRSTLFILVCGIVMMLSGLQGVGAAEIPETLTLSNYWMYDGYLSNDLQEAGFTVIPNQPIILYKNADTTSEVVSVVPAGQASKLLKIVYIAHPKRYQFEIKQAMALPDGKSVLMPGEMVGYVSRSGSDTLAVYHNGVTIMIDAIGVELPESVRQLKEAENQWLFLVDAQGVGGWCQFRSNNQTTSERWQIQPHAAGGSANFNVIVFGSTYPPPFQRLPVFSSENNAL